jgi:AraC-like DNA-binding protein
LVRGRRFEATRFSTADVPERHRVAAWREYYGRIVLKVDVEPRKNVPFECALTSRVLPDLQVLRAQMSPVRVARTPELTAKSGDDLVLIVNLEGTLATSGSGRSEVLNRGDAVLMSSSDVSTFDRASVGRSLGIRVPRLILMESVLNVEDRIMYRIPQDAGGLRLLWNYTNAIIDEDATNQPEIRSAAVNHVHDLIALILGASSNAAERARVQGVAAARLKMARLFISRNSGRHGLSVHHVAKHLGVTERAVQKMFEKDGTTFTAFLLDQRLRRARRMLTEPKWATNAISSIAFEVGFGDLSYFIRCFKQRYGETPRSARYDIKG